MCSFGQHAWLYELNLVLIFGPRGEAYVEKCTFLDATGNSYPAFIAFHNPASTASFQVTWKGRG